MSARGRRQLGPYRLLGSLGKGGNAQVFKAEHRHLGQLRALKILFPGSGRSPDVVGRLVTEARAMARLRHPAIVEVYECDVLADGTAFIAMEYLRGETLRSWLQRVGKLRAHPRLAGAIAGAIADGLRFAHARGVVHRDLKPENVLLIPTTGDRQGFSVKILDFGIAKLLREEPLTRTRIGCVVGTPVYMAPEQWRPGTPVGLAADLYALGCLLFELLTGRPPFDESDEMALMRAHLEDPPPPLGSVEPGLPEGWGRLLDALLAKDPAARPDGAASVIRALETLVGRSDFAGLLRAPAGWPVVARDTAGLAPVPPRRARPPSTSAALSVLRSSLTGAWRGLGDRRRWPLLAACLGALFACLLLGAVLLMHKHRAAGPVAASPLPTHAGLMTKPRLPESSLASTFKVIVTSAPPGAQVWVEDEPSPRGRTPLQLEFVSLGPKPLRLVAPGFQPATLSVWVGRESAGHVVLRRAGPRAARARAYSGTPYRRVED